MSTTVTVKQNTQMSASLNREVLERFIANPTDAEVIASTMHEDVTLTAMFEGTVRHGVEEVTQRIVFIYAVAFDAKVVVNNVVYSDSGAIVEFQFVGEHIGEFAGIPATGKEVDMPLVVAYETEEGKITAIRAYFNVVGLVRYLSE